MSANEPAVDVAGRTVVHAGITFTMRPLTEDSLTILVAGVPVGRAVYSFGANAVLEGDPHEGVTEEVLQAVSEAWFAAAEG